MPAGPVLLEPPAPGMLVVPPAGIKHPVSVVGAFSGVPGTLSVTGCWAPAASAAIMTAIICVPVIVHPLSYLWYDRSDTSGGMRAPTERGCGGDRRRYARAAPRPR